IQGVPRGTLFGVVSLKSDMVMYYFVFALLVAVFLAIRRIVSSPFGQVLKAIRENEPRAVSLGYTVERYKLLVFVLSATLAGLGGSLKALALGFATLTDVLQGTSGEVILMTLLGGAGTFLGPVVGAGVVVTLQDVLSDRVGSWVSVIIGAIFVVCVLAFRKGIVGETQAFLDRRRGRVQPAPPPAAPAPGNRESAAGSGA
ncbi:MAG TPA: branched-chain amino acid ABC transporter permease, partial [Ramlibacter sp.]|nr:branched-chain amino acid ABC transporter permease [Ramlibacter sp.]